jgi:thiamine pyrophosphokinase
MANGVYGDPQWYSRQSGNFDRVFCADGGANQARLLGITPDLLLGDMDSVAPPERKRLQAAGVDLQQFPATKDFTDTDLALEQAVAQGATEITVWGGTGSRLDHTLANICSAGRFALQGVKVCFRAPELSVYLVASRLDLKGKPGDTVSVLVIGERAAGVTLRGFAYPLEDALLEGLRPIGVSNQLTAESGLIEVRSGLLAVFHYRMLPE